MAIQFFFSANYERAVSEIEDFIFGAERDISAVESFLDEHDRALRFIEQNPETPAIHPATGDQSWVFGDGRYRLFYSYSPGESAVYLTHLIDNRRANIEIYPENKIPTYFEDDS